MGLAGWVAPAHALPTSFTSPSFITVTDPGTVLQFTFDGVSAADTDVMRLVFNGQVLFTNQTATVGDTATTGPLAPGVYQISLTNLNTGVTYSSDPFLNPGSEPHLAFSNDFSDFNLGALPANAGPAPYFGWEDRPLTAGSTLDYNDLVFSVQAVPEPATLLLLGSGLLAFGLIRRRNT